MITPWLGDTSATGEDVLAIVAPHAGYVYSGEIAAEAYRRIRVPDLAVILCPNHTGEGPPISLWPHGSWETPLGEVPVAEPLARKILDAFPEARADRDAHEFEHAIEVQLPFLQLKNPAIRIVPVVLGPLLLERCLRFGGVLADVIAKTVARPTDVLLVASTDMSHYLAAARAREIDRPALDAIAERDPEKLYRTVAENEISMCGFIPTTAALAAANRLGATTSRVLRYGNSGEASGNFERVVAYASAIIS